MKTVTEIQIWAMTKLQEVNNEYIEALENPDIEESIEARGYTHSKKMILKELIDFIEDDY